MANEQPIHVLQLADLLVGAGDPGADYERLTRRLAAIDRGPLGGGVAGRADWFDYIVICGNLTQNGTPAELTLAEALIRELARRFLRPELCDEHWARRLIVVPGANDLPDGNHAEFDDAYGRLGLGAHDYEEPAGGPWHGAQPEQFRLTVRTDGNLTAIGFYWNAQAIGDDARARLWNRVRDGLRSWSAGGPVLLVSSSVPFPMEAEDYLPNHNLVHLLGRTDDAMLDRVRYHALGWERPQVLTRLYRAHILALRGETWRVQTCEFSLNGQTGWPEQKLAPKTSPRAPRQVKKLSRKRFASRASFDRPNSDRPFARDRARLLAVLDGKGSPPPTPPPADAWLPPERRASQGKKVYLVRGLPGVGKFGFFQEMKTIGSAPRSAELRYHIEPVKLWFDDPHHECIAAIETAKQRLRTALRGGQSRGILMVFKKETPARPVRPDVSADCQRFLLDYLRNTPVAEMFDILYLTDDETGLNKYLKPQQGHRTSRSANVLQRGTEEFWLRPLAPDEWRGLLSQYPHVPFDERDLQSFTGRMHGLSVRVLETLGAAVAGPGDESTITRKARWNALVEMAQSNGGVAALANKLCDLVRSFPSLIQEHLIRHVKKRGLTPPPDGVPPPAPLEFNTSRNNFLQDVHARVHRPDPEFDQRANREWVEWRKLLAAWRVQPAHPTPAEKAAEEATRTATSEAVTKAAASAAAELFDAGPILPFITSRLFLSEGADGGDDDTAVG